MSSVSSLSSSSFSRRSIQEGNENPLLRTGMLLGFQRLEERIITSITCNDTQLPVVPSIIDSIGCDITLDDIQSAKQELLNKGVDLKMDVHQKQKLRREDGVNWEFTPLHHFCWTGNLVFVRFLVLIGADCTELDKFGWYPMLVAANKGHLDICKWLFEYGGGAKDQINKEASHGVTPLGLSYLAWHHGYRIDKEGKICRWLLQNGGGQHLSNKAMRCMYDREGKEEINSSLLVLWTRKNIQLYDTFILFLCGASIISLSSEASDDGGTRTHKREQKIPPERSLQILDGHPGMMELIGNYVGVIRGQEIRRLQEFNELVIEYSNTGDSSSSSSDDDDDDDSDNSEDED